MTPEVREALTTIYRESSFLDGPLRDTINRAISMIESVFDSDDDAPICRTCGEPYDDAGDGWDGECPDCADRTAADEEEEG